MYDVIFQSDNQKSNYVVLVSAIPTIEEAKEKRVLLGDLVVHHGTNEVVDDEDWLTEIEKNNPDCYAKRKMQEV